MVFEKWFVANPKLDRLCERIVNASPERQAHECDMQRVKILWESGGAQLADYLQPYENLIDTYPEYELIKSLSAIGWERYLAAKFRPT